MTETAERVEDRLADFTRDKRMLTVLWLRRSILTEKVARRGFHVTREYSVDPLAVLRVGEVMDRNPPTVPAQMKVSELSDLIANGDPVLSPRGRLAPRAHAVTAFNNYAEGVG